MGDHVATVALSESFIESMADLGAADAKRTAGFLAKLTRAEDLASLRPELVHEAGDRTIRSLRINKEMRAIAHLDGEQWLLLYVGQHDDAYAWARDRCLLCHPMTGELQIVADPHRAESRLATWEQHQVPGIFDDLPDRYLLSVGTPPEWIPTIRQIKSEEMFLAVADDLPDGVAERLMRVATGELVPPPTHQDVDRILDAESTHSWICTVGDTDSLCRLLDSRGIPYDSMA